MYNDIATNPPPKDGWLRRTLHKIGRYLISISTVKQEPNTVELSSEAEKPGIKEAVGLSCRLGVFDNLGEIEKRKWRMYLIWREKKMSELVSDY